MNLKPKTLCLGILLGLTSMANNQVHAYQASFTDQEAFELGMTPLEAYEFDVNELKTNHTNKLETIANLAPVVIAVNKKASGAGAQTLKVFQEGIEVFETKVSTGTETRVTSTSGKSYVTTTPLGNYRPTKVYKDYLSYTWNAPMPHAVFFIGGIAIHATGKSNYSKLGSRASGGCVRVTLEDSEYLYNLVLGTGLPTYVIRRESNGRNRVNNGSIQVAQVNRDRDEFVTRNGNPVMVQSWDTIIKVYQ
jgi:lipoprotein-anchoring transpeptidase ErfK/SrfK